MSGSDLLTSTQAAGVLGVAPSSVKRWADEGLLQCIRTPGGHRRFRRTELERFAARERGRHGGGTAAGQNGLSIPLNEWMEALLGPSTAFAVHARLLETRERLGSWWATAEEVATVIEEVGARWESGSVSVLEEHLATEQLSRALARCVESMPVSPTARRALLALPEGEEHALGLALAELCMVEAGLFTRWAGFRTPGDEILARRSTTRPSISSRCRQPSPLPIPPRWRGWFTSWARCAPTTPCNCW